MSDDYKVLTGKFFIDFQGDGKPVEVVERSELEAMRARAEAAEREILWFQEKLKDRGGSLGFIDAYDQLRRENEGLVGALECINDEVGDSQGRDVPIIRKIVREAIAKFGGKK